MQYTVPSGRSHTDMRRVDSGHGPVRGGANLDLNLLRAVDEEPPGLGKAGDEGAVPAQPLRGLRQRLQCATEPVRCGSAWRR